MTDPVCPVCGETYINRGAHAEACTGEPRPKGANEKALVEYAVRLAERARGEKT